MLTDLINPIYRPYFWRLPKSLIYRLFQTSRSTNLTRSAARASAGTPETARGIVSLRQGLQSKVSPPSPPQLSPSPLYPSCLLTPHSSSFSPLLPSSGSNSPQLSRFQNKFYFTPEKPAAVRSQSRNIASSQFSSLANLTGSRSSSLSGSTSCSTKSNNSSSGRSFRQYISSSDLSLQSDPVTTVHKQLQSAFVCGKNVWQVTIDVLLNSLLIFPALMQVFSSFWLSRVLLYRFLFSIIFSHHFCNWISGFPLDLGFYHQPSLFLMFWHY